jgi:3-oxoacyl-[acyl-carrier protein] reductase
MSAMSAESSDLFNLAGQVAVVTGAGSRGIGRALARRLAAAGASVALLDRSTSGVEETSALISRAGGKSIPLTCDIVDRDAVRATVEAAENELGPIDILVNNAAIAGVTGLDWEVDPAEWWRVMEVNVLGQFHVAQSVLPGMVSRRSGRIVNVSSSAGGRAVPGYSSYCSSKAAVTLWSECLAAVTADYGVIVLAFTPATVRTDLNEELASRPDNDNPVIRVNRIVKERLEEGRDVPIEKVVKQLMYVATGYVDALSGRQIDMFDDLDELLDRSQEIEELDLNVSRVRLLDGRAPGQP